MADQGDAENNLFIHKAFGAISRLNVLIGELMDVSKIQQGKLDYVIAPFSINEILLSAIEDVQLAAPEHKLILTGNIDHAITGDKERLKQVVINLLTNAVKYSPGNSSVQLHVVEKGDEVIVSVTDRGIGINKKNINKIFELYYREEGEAMKFLGLGIGLAISAEIVARHHGKNLG